MLVFRASSVAYGSFQARRQTGAAAASLHHSHSHVGYFFFFKLKIFTGHTHTYRVVWLLLRWLYDILLYKLVLFNQSPVEIASDLFSVSYFRNSAEVNTHDCILWHLWVYPENKYLYLFIYFFFFVFCPFRAIPTAYGGSQARGLIKAVAAGLYHSHSNTGFELRLRPTPQLTATLDP